ncbi:MAG: hypothetical protein IJY48_00500 [Mailhella sp.]|nr:hypothetical protein [Mailhella sp.]
MLKRSFLAATLALAPLLVPFLMPGPAEAASERGITLVRYECQLCDKEYYTFKPDSIGCSRGETRTRQYQSANWYVFKGKRSIPACSKAGGAHIFERKGEVSTDPMGVVKKLEWLVYTKNSGGSLHAQLVRMKCMGCSMEAYAFACDDLDYERNVDLRRRNTWTTMDGQRPRECSWKPAWGGGARSPFHLMKDAGRRSINSRDLANIMSQVICSQP